MTFRNIKFMGHSKEKTLYNSKLICLNDLTTLMINKPDMI